MTSDNITPSNPSENPPQQQSLPWTINNWLAAFQQNIQQAQQAQATRTPPTQAPSQAPTQPPLTQTTSKKEPVKEEPMSDMLGGWRFEGKEKPETPKICTRCQWERKNDQMSEPDKSMWCESCLEGKPGVGHEPDKGYRPPAVSASQDAATLNQTFFG